ncbi:hypothetical protein ACMWDS_23905, partial [Klebsiella pneumoniae]
VNDFMDSVHHIWCPLSSQEYQDLPDGAETTLTHEHQKRDLVRIGDSSFYPGLFVDGNGILQQVNPSIMGKDVKVTCRCCTHTYMGEPVPGKYE